MEHHPKSSKPVQSPWALDSRDLRPVQVRPGVQPLQDLGPERRRFYSQGFLDPSRVSPSYPPSHPSACVPCGLYSLDTGVAAALKLPMRGHSLAVGAALAHFSWQPLPWVPGVQSSSQPASEAAAHTGACDGVARGPRSGTGTRLLQ